MDYQERYEALIEVLRDTADELRDHREYSLEPGYSGPFEDGVRYAAEEIRDVIRYAEGEYDD